MENTMIRGLVSVVFTGAMITGPVLLAGASLSAAKGSGVATGGVTCTTATGTAQFSPALTKKGNSNTETTKFKVALSGCTTTGSNVANIVSGTLAVTIHKSTKTKVANACASLNIGTLATNSVLTWTSTGGTVVKASTLKTTGEAWSVTADPLNFTLPGTGTATVTGSFAGADKGALSTFAASFKNTLVSFTKACSGGTNHLSKVTLSGGSLTLG
jgi:hypothetical protein